MAVPPLRIPLGLSMDEFQKNIESAKSLTSSATRHLTQQFLQVNKDIAASAAGAAGLWALRWVSQVALIVGALKLMGDAVGAAREQLKEMVDLANTAQNVGVSSSFFQRWSAEAKKLQVDTSDLEAALSHAFNATKDKAPVDLSKWETGKDQITDVERALRIYNETVAKAVGQRLEGLVLFRDADTQEKKVQAVLQAMIQLEQIGQKAAALDLGERMFGAQFVDKIRQGRTSAESMLSTLQNAKGDADGIFPDALVQRAKEMDDQLKIAHQRLSTALKPSWDDLADVLLTIKGYWSEVVGMIAKAVELSNQIGKYLPVTDNSLDAKRSALDTVNRRLNGTSGWTETYGIFASRKTLEDQRDRLQSEIAAAAKGDQYGPNLPSQSRGTGERPKLKPTDTGADKFESGVDAINKRIAALRAEAGALDLGTEARDRAKIAAQLETVAKQANSAAGLGNNVITAEQRKVIDEVSAAYGKATVAMEKARVASQIKFDKATAFLSQEDVAIAAQLKRLYPDVATALNSAEANAMRTNEAMRTLSASIESNLTAGLVDAISGAKSFGDAMSNMGKMVIRSLEEMIVKMLIVGPLMRSMSGLGGVLGLPALAIPKMADGGVIPPGGLALVSEHSPGGGRLVRAGNEPIMVTPNNIQPSRSSGSNSFNVTISMAGANGDATIRQIAAQATLQGSRAVLSQVPGMAVKAVSEHMKRAG